MKPILFKKKKCIVSVLTILLSFTLLSCSKHKRNDEPAYIPKPDYPKPDYYTVNGALKYNTSYDINPPKTNNEGWDQFHVRFSIENDIEGYTSWNELYKIDVINSFFELRLVGASFYPGDNIIIELADYNNNKTYNRIEYNINSKTSSLDITESDRDYYNFVKYLFQELKHYGYVELNIFVDMIDKKKRPITYQKFDVFFENNLKLYYWNR